MRIFLTAIGYYWRSSIRRRMVLSFGLSTLALMLGSGYLLYLQQRDALYLTEKEHAGALAIALANSSTSWVLARDLAGLQEVVDGSRNSRDLVYLLVQSRSGEVLASLHRAQVGLFVQDALSTQLLRQEQAQLQVLLDQPVRLEVAAPIVASNQLLGWVRVGMKRDAVNRDLQQMLYFLLWFALLASLLVSLVATALAQGLARRFGCFMEATGKIKAGDHAIRMPVVYPDELGAMAQDVNAMLDVLCESELRFRQLAENIHEVFWMTTVDKQQMLYVSPAYEHIWGRSVQSLLDWPLSWLESVHPNDQHKLRDSLQKQVAGQYDVEYRVLRPDGEIRWVRDTAYPVRDAQGELYRLVGVAEDITPRKLALEQLQNSEERLDFMAHHDALTGLPNRTRLFASLAEAMQSPPVVLFMLDLDRFKNVNDSFGHAAGDDLLCQVAQRLTLLFPDESVVARLGGDEFTILLERAVDNVQLGALAEKVIAELSAPYQLPVGAQVNVGVSVGISRYPEHGQNGADLLQHADAALYEAKGRGRGQYRFFEARMSQHVRERIQMENDLRLALDAGLLVVYYQPVLELVSGHIVGAEALVRWQPVDGPMIMPGQFISIAEDSGLIARIGELVLHSACQQGEAWLQAGYPALRLSVNLSPRQIQHCNVQDRVRSILAQTSYPDSHLTLELTESALMQHEEMVITLLHNLRNMGVHLAIDDFGTGYSSLAYLKDFPLDVLKVDKRFVDHIATSPRERALLASIIDMAHILGFKVLAEGVETQAQFDILAEQQCDLLQGYWLSPPVPAAEFEKCFLQSGQPVRVEAAVCQQRTNRLSPQASSADTPA